MNKSEMKAKQMNVAIRAFLANATLTESELMAMADLYMTWEQKLATKQDVKVGEVLSYGVNVDNETQLYQVVQAHTPQENWTPDVSASLYKKIGFTEDATPIWTPPLGVTDANGVSDAYMKGDVVSHKDNKYTSDIDYNVWEPGVYGWTIK